MLRACAAYAYSLPCADEAEEDDDAGQEHAAAKEIHARAVMTHPRGIIHNVVVTLHAHPQCGSIQRNGMDALFAIVHVPRVGRWCALPVVKGGGVKLLMDALRSDPELLDEDMVAAAYDTLRALFRGVPLVADMVDEEFLYLATPALRTITDRGSSKVGRDWVMWANVMGALHAYLGSLAKADATGVNVASGRLNVARATGVIELAMYGFRKHADIVEETKQFHSELATDFDAREHLYEALCNACLVLHLMCLFDARESDSYTTLLPHEQVASEGAIELIVAAILGYVAFRVPDEAAEGAREHGDDFLVNSVGHLLPHLLRFDSIRESEERDLDSVGAAMHTLVGWPSCPARTKRDARVVLSILSGDGDADVTNSSSSSDSDSGSDQ